MFRGGTGANSGGRTRRGGSRTKDEHTPVRIASPLDTRKYPQARRGALDERGVGQRKGTQDLVEGASSTLLAGIARADHQLTPPSIKANEIILLGVKARGAPADGAPKPASAPAPRRGKPPRKAKEEVLSEIPRGARTKRPPGLHVLTERDHREEDPEYLPGLFVHSQLRRLYINQLTVGCLSSGEEETDKVDCRDLGLGAFTEARGGGRSGASFLMSEGTGLTRVPSEQRYNRSSRCLVSTARTLPYALRCLPGAAPAAGRTAADVPKQDGNTSRGRYALWGRVSRASPSGDPLQWPCLYRMNPP